MRIPPVWALGACQTG
ncbi:hypothetical protein OYC64_018236 [Pagothenia borchgrevinki]|uniref:Uncharacterized protein n=1 Tax=Pagothenia borchgrevinki TaxID=8213 RepID=A0ABD2GN48_PAGBO